MLPFPKQIPFSLSEAINFPSLGPLHITIIKSYSNSKSLKHTYLKPHIQTHWEGEAEQSTQIWKWRRYRNSSSSPLNVAWLLAQREAQVQAHSFNSLAGKQLCGCCSAGNPLSHHLAADFSQSSRNRFWSYQRRRARIRCGNSHWRSSLCLLRPENKKISARRFILRSSLAVRAVGVMESGRPNRFGIDFVAGLYWANLGAQSLRLLPSN